MATSRFHELLCELAKQHEIELAQATAQVETNGSISTVHARPVVDLLPDGFSDRSIVESLPFSKHLEVCEGEEVGGLSDSIGESTVISKARPSFDPVSAGVAEAPIFECPPISARLVPSEKEEDRDQLSEQLSPMAEGMTCLSETPGLCRPGDEHSWRLDERSTGHRGSGITHIGMGMPGVKSNDFAVCAPLLTAPPLRSGRISLPGGDATVPDFVPESPSVVRPVLVPADEDTAEDVPLGSSTRDTVDSSASGSCVTFDGDISEEELQDEVPTEVEQRPQLPDPLWVKVYDWLPWRDALRVLSVSREWAVQVGADERWISRATIMCPAFVLSMAQPPFPWHAVRPFTWLQAFPVLLKANHIFNGDFMIGGEGWVAFDGYAERALTGNAAAALSAGRQSEVMDFHLCNSPGPGEGRTLRGRAGHYPDRWAKEIRHDKIRVAVGSTVYVSCWARSTIPGDASLLFEVSWAGGCIHRGHKATDDAGVWQQLQCVYGPTAYESDCVITVRSGSRERYSVFREVFVLTVDPEGRCRFAPRVDRF